MERVETHHGNDGGAVRVGDDAFGPIFGSFRIDLGYYEGNLGIHPEGGGVIDHHRARGGGRGPKFAGETASCAEEGNIDAFKRVVVEFLDHHFTVPEEELPAGRARGGEESEFPHGKVTLYKTL